MKELLDRFDAGLTRWMRQYGVAVLRYSVALIFIWFGALKVVGFSPATELVTRTVYWVDASWFVPFLGVWEIVIGACFLVRPLLRLGIALLAPQMFGTFLPLVLLPGVVYQGGNPLALTITGQYIVKNLIIIGAAIVVGSTVRFKQVALVDV